MVKTIISTGIFILFFTSLYSQLWKQYADSGKTYNNQKNSDKAIEFYYKAKESLQKDSMGTNTYAQICDSLGVSFYRKNQYKETEKFYLEEKKLREKVLGKEHPDYARACSKLGIVYWRMRLYQKAEPLFLEAKQIWARTLGREHFDYAAFCSQLASLYFDMGQYGKAKPLYLEAKQILEKVSGKEDPYYASSCNDLAAFYREIGQYERAEPLYLEAKQIREKTLGKEHPDYAASCNNLGKLYMYIGKYEKAELLFLEAKQIRETTSGKEDPEYAASCNDLANLYTYMGQFEKAELLYLEAKQIREKTLGKQDPGYAESCNDLGVLYLYMKQVGKATPLLHEAKQIREKVLGKGHPAYAASSNRLAFVYFYTGQFEKAEPLFLEAKLLQEKVLGKEHPDYAVSCFTLALFYADRGQYEKAEQLYLEAKQVMQKALGKRHPNYGSLCGNLASLYGMMHKPLQAENEFKEAFSVNTYNLNSVFQFTDEREKTAFIKNIFGEDDKAYSFYLSYLSRNLKSELPYAISLFHRNLILSSSEALKKRLFFANDTVAIRKYNEWINLKKHLSIQYLKPINERKEEVAKIEENAGQLERELTRLSSGFKNQQQKVYWNEIKNRLRADEASIEFVSFHLCNSTRRTDTVIYLALVLRKDIRMPAMIYLFYETQLTHSSFDRLRMTTDKLRMSTDRPLMTSDRPTMITHDSVTGLGASISKDEESSIVINKSIYDLVWKPLEKELKGIKTIYFASSGMLHKIPFAAIPINQKEVLSDRYRLIQLTTTASITDQNFAFITSSDNLQLYGGVKYDADSTELKQTIPLYSVNTNKEKTRSIPDDLSRSGSFSYLPGTEAEIKSIEKQAKETQNHISALSGIRATEESFKALDGKGSPSVLHIATHGFFFPDPKEDKRDNVQRMFDTSGKAFKQSDNPLFRSGLLFAGANNAWKGNPAEGLEDGILTAYEVSNMYFPNTKLVVLSACETALGDIEGSEGVYGLQRAFKIAGVQNLVMSLWKVPDVETAEFMQLFYKNMFARQLITDAFYHAQTIMKNKYRNNPYKWAAWVLVR